MNSTASQILDFDPNGSWANSHPAEMFISSVSSTLSLAWLIWKSKAYLARFPYPGKLSPKAGRPIDTGGVQYASQRRAFSPIEFWRCHLKSTCWYSSALESQQTLRRSARLSPRGFGRGARCTNVNTFGVLPPRPWAKRCQASELGLLFWTTTWI